MYSTIHTCRIVHTFDYFDNNIKYVWNYVYIVV